MAKSFWSDRQKDQWASKKNGWWLYRFQWAMARLWGWTHCNGIFPELFCRFNHGTWHLWEELFWGEDHTNLSKLNRVVLHRLLYILRRDDWFPGDSNKDMRMPRTIRYYHRNIPVSWPRAAFSQIFMVMPPGFPNIIHIVSSVLLGERRPHHYRRAEAGRK